MDDTRVSDSTSSQESQVTEVSEPVFEVETTATDHVELEARPTEAGQRAVAEALEAIKHRSFSGRHPELGKMIKCQVCGRRHRESEKHEQRFAKRMAVVDGKRVNLDEQLIAGETKETQFDKTVEADIPTKQARVVFGTAMFKGKRRNPPKNKRQLRFVEIVRSLTPDEYTEEDLSKARKKAARTLGMTKKKTYGWTPKKVKKTEEQ